MPSHIKMALTRPSECIPFADGRMPSARGRESPVGASTQGACASWSTVVGERRRLRRVSSRLLSPPRFCASAGPMTSRADRPRGVDEEIVALVVHEDEGGKSSTSIFQTASIPNSGYRAPRLCECSPWRELPPVRRCCRDKSRASGMRCHLRAAIALGEHHHRAAVGLEEVGSCPSGWRLSANDPEVLTLRRLRCRVIHRVILQTLRSPAGISRSLSFAWAISRAISGR